MPCQQIKYTALFCFFTGVMAFKSTAQTGFYREGTTPERVQGKMVTAGDHLFVNAVSLEAADAGLSNIYRYDVSGNTIRFTTGKYVWNMLPIAGNRLLLLSEERRCTFNPDTLDFFIEIITADGALLSSLKVDDGVSCIVQTPDSSFLAFLWDNKTLVRLNKSLTSYTQSPHTLGNVWDAVLLNNQIIVSHSSGSGERLSLLSAQGTVVTTSLVPKPLIDLRMMGQGRISSYTQNVLYVYDTTLIQQQAIPVTHISDYYCADDTIYAIMRKTAGPAVYYTILDKFMNVISQSLIPNYEPVSIAGFKTSSAIICEPFTLSKGWLGHYLAVNNRRHVPTLTKNLALSTSIDSAYFIPRGDGFYDVYARLKFGVKGIGATSEKFTITTELSAEALCGTNYYSQSFSLQIKAGSIHSVLSDKFVKKIGELYNGSVFVEYCSTVARPDDEMDNTPQNNLSCAGFSFDPVSVRVFSSNDFVRLFPNPVNDRLHYSSNASVRKLTLMTIDGSVIDGQAGGGFAGNIDVSKLTSGLYLIRLETESGMINLKFVKF